jgi:penicillin-binding protein 2
MAKRKNSDSSRGFVDSGRQRFLLGIILVFGLIYLGRLVQLQVVSSTQYLEKTRSQAVKRIRVKPHRGNIYDKNGKQIVFNEMAFSVAVTPIDFKDYCTPLLSNIIGMRADSILDFVKRNGGINRFNQMKISGNVDYEIVCQIEEYSDFLPGVSIFTETKRVYDLNCRMPHVLGYTREISEKQLRTIPGYRMGDIIGQTGVEAAYDSWLHGTDGTNFYTVNNYGEKVETFATNALNVKPKNGSDIFLTIDTDLQAKGEEAMKGRRGAIVALDPNNGEILAMVSAPDYEITGFTGKIKQEFLDEVYGNPDKPLFNRAIAAKYPPGSTWKMMIGIAGIAEGILDENGTFYCPGFYDLGDRQMACHGAHANIAVRNALKFSCNTYFGKLGNELGIERFHKWGDLFNFGRPTKIDIAGEIGGLLPDRDYLDNRFGKYGVTHGRLANFGIGQGEILVTPLQLAVYTAALANGGRIIQPHVVSQIDTPTGESMPVDYSITELPIKTRTLEAIKDGMHRVVNGGGTGGAAYVPGKNVCGKTGTAQNPHGDNHALFVCFAPRENPEIAIAVVVENAGYGGDVAAPIARKVLMQHFYPEWSPEYEEENPLEEFIPETVEN